MTISENNKARLIGLVILFVILCMFLYALFGQFMSNGNKQNENVLVDNIIIYNDKGETVFNLYTGESSDPFGKKYQTIHDKIQMAEENNYDIDYISNNVTYHSMEELTNESPIKRLYNVIKSNNLFSFDFLICSITRCALVSNENLDNVCSVISGGTGLISWLFFIIPIAIIVFYLLRALIFGIETEISELGALVLFALFAYISYFIRIINDLARYNQALQYFYILSLFTIWVLVLICELSIKLYKKENGSSLFDVKFTLQSGEYKGSIVTQISGNISPYEALKHLDTNCDEIKPVQSDCGYTEAEDDEGNWRFEAILKNTEGETCHIEDECSHLEDYIVAAEITGCEKTVL